MCERRTVDQRHGKVMLRLIVHFICRSHQTAQLRDIGSHGDCVQPSDMP